MGNNIASKNRVGTALRAIALALLSLIAQLAFGYLTNTAISPGLAQVPTNSVNSTHLCELVQAGRESYELGNFANAAIAWKQTEHKYQTLENQLCRAMTLSNLALAYQQQGHLLEAIKTNQQSLQLILNAPDTNNSSEQLLNISENLLQTTSNSHNSVEQLRILAQALNTQGKLDLLIGQNEQAIKTWQLANAAYQQVNDQTGILRSQINLAQAMQAQGHYRDASQILLKTLGIKFNNETSNHNNQEQQINEVIKKLPVTPINITLLHTLGNVYLSLGEYVSANGIFTVMQESLNSNKELANHLKYNQWLADTWLSLGNVQKALAHRARELDNLPKAQQQAKKAINYYQLAEKIISNNSKLTATQSSIINYNLQLALIHTQVQLNRLDVLLENELLDQKNPQKLSNFVSQLQFHINYLPNSVESIYAQINLSSNLINLLKKSRDLKISFDNIDEKIILIELDTAIKKSRNLGNKRAESYAVGTIGHLYEITQQWEQAFKYTQDAFYLAQEIKAQDVSYQWEWQMGRILSKQGKTKDAISAYKSAVRSLDLIRGNLLGLNTEVQFSFRDNIEPIYRELVSLLLPVDQSQTNPAQVQEAIQQIDNLQLAELQNFLRCDLSELLQINPNQVIKQNDSPEIINQTLEEFGEHKAAIIYPIILEDRVVVIFKLPGEKLEYRFTRKPESEVRIILQKLQNELLNPSHTTEVKTLSKEVYQWIIAPIKKDLQNHQNLETLVFVLDRELKNIPMAVLYDGQEYLVQSKYAIAVAPSLGVIDSKYIKRESRILAAAMTEKRTVGQDTYDPLPNAINEIEEIYNIGKQIFVKKLVNPDFTKANLQKEIDSGQFSIVHMATHGKFSSYSEETYILTYESHLTGQDLDNLVRPSSRNSQNSSSRIDLLTLSACETAKGDNRAALGLAGISIRAGARSTLSTLWEADDEPTAKLMVQFYKELSNPKVTKAEALHRAQLAIFDARYKSPKIWANYVLIGNWL
ncbi:CHAT domain-containing protein [Anabaena azotica]|uniref:CHAT domain-containing protein n=1 Tax=Anabaena azotica TaxID=197653 RepID=UPI0039A45487